MPENDLEYFVRLVLNSEELQAELREVTERREFVQRVVELADQRGCEFSVADIDEAMRSNRQRWLKI